MPRAIRTKPVVRKEHIINAAIQLSIKVGYKCITRDAVAEIARVSSPLVATYFPRMSNLKLAVIQRAIQDEIVEVLAQGLILNDKKTWEISDKLKKKVLAYITKIT